MASYEELSDFVAHKMRLSHVYQPVMLQALLESGGRATAGQLAERLLAMDASQREYYEQIVHNMVGRVLRGRGIVERNGAEYRLPDFEGLTKPQRHALTEALRKRLEAYVAARGKSIWEHRRRGHRPISGTVRYEVLKAAGFRCELCGVPADERALEVDHIEPKIRGGKDDISNYQALCYSCNASKRDRDNTDFRRLKILYSTRQGGCPFCDPSAERIVQENPLALALRDGHPVTRLHTLVLPRRHVAGYFDLTSAETRACERLLAQSRRQLMDDDPTISGFNLGVNAGADAGQTVEHAHIHLIPRRHGDVAVPKGGVRGVIPGRAEY